jgi:hypothetical protein
VAVRAKNLKVGAFVIPGDSILVVNLENFGMLSPSADFTAFKPPSLLHGVPVSVFSSAASGSLGTAIGAVLRRAFTYSGRLVWISANLADISSKLLGSPRSLAFIGTKIRSASWLNLPTINDATMLAGAFDTQSAGCSSRDVRTLTTAPLPSFELASRDMEGVSADWACDVSPSLLGSASPVLFRTNAFSADARRSAVQSGTILPAPEVGTTLRADYVYGPYKFLVTRLGAADRDCRSKRADRVGATTERAGLGDSIRHPMGIGAGDGTESRHSIFPWACTKLFFAPFTGFDFHGNFTSEVRS